MLYALYSTNSNEVFRKSVAIFCIIFSYQSTTAQGSLWGMTYGGGASNLGVIFKTDAQGNNFEVKKEFTTQYPGDGGWYTKLCEATLTTGKLYGLSQTGIIYEYDLISGADTKKIDLANISGKDPRGNLVQASNGKLYGMTRDGGDFNFGMLFEYDPVANTCSKKVDFDGNSKGGAPVADLVQASNGKLYGMTFSGGVNNYGVIFEFDPSTAGFLKSLDFDGTNGASPEGTLTQAMDGNLYGMTTGGGANQMGVLFEFNTNTYSYNKKVDFDGGLKGTPGSNSLMQASDGKLYGMTVGGGLNGAGVLFDYDFNNDVYSKHLDFDGASNGGTPQGNLLEASDGKLYGMTINGGRDGNGILFEFDLDQNTLSKKMDFDRSKGTNPFGTLIQAANGKLYGITANGGTGLGVLFEYDLSDNTYSKKIDFSSSDDGFYPLGSLVQATNGRFYGFCWYGGSNGYGVIFEYDPITGIYSKKYDFNKTDGSYPMQNLSLGDNGKLYGMANGGANDSGVLFEFDPATGKYNKKIDFNGSGYGAYPNGNLIKATNGKFYGVTSQGGVNGGGVLFEYDAGADTFTKKIDLDDTNGSHPYGGLTQSSNGKFYGITQNGGAYGDGVIFEYDLDLNSFTKKFDFGLVVNGMESLGNLIETNGKLYGMTYMGGLNNLGVIFEFDPATGNYVDKFDFDGTNGGYTETSLTLAPNGKLYGLSTNGGVDNIGVLFEYDPVSNVYTKKLDFNGANGAAPVFTQLLYEAPRQNQTIAFSPLSAATFGEAPFNLAATTTSGLPVIFASSDTLIANVNGNKVSIVAAGNVIITAIQPGSINYNPAPDVSQPLLVSKKEQIISFDSITSVTMGNSPFSIIATSSAGLRVSYKTSTPARIAMTDSLVSLLSAGKATVIAAQTGNSNYDSARSVSQIFCINPPKPIISITNANTGTPTLTSSAGTGNQWYKDGLALSGETSRTLTVKSSGNYTLKVAIEMCESEPSDNLPLIITGDIVEHRSPELSPNPANNFVELRFSRQGLKTIAVFQLTGDILQIENTYDDHLLLDVANFTGGYYIVKVIDESDTYYAKFIKR